MDDETTNAEVNYVLVVRKSPLLIAGMILFGWAAIKCYEAWVSMEPLAEGDET